MTSSIDERVILVTIEIDCAASATEGSIIALKVENHVLHSLIL